jgi:predicted Rossmann fold nucleotide-binding protein DprA/Smf involved in DNA uptake
MGEDRVLQAIEAACAEIRKEKNRRLKEVNNWYDAEIGRCERVRRALPAVQGADPDNSKKPRRRKSSARVRTKRLSTSPKSVAARRDKVSRYIEESPDPVFIKGIAQALGLTISSVRTAIHALEEEGRVRSVGTNSSTRYTTGKHRSSLASTQAPTQGSTEDRIVAVIRDRSHASADELGQALGIPVPEVIQVCARLQAEEKIRMNRIGNKSVYVIARRA